jgi:hypothetical protein
MWLCEELKNKENEREYTTPIQTAIENRSTQHNHFFKRGGFSLTYNID